MRALRLPRRSFTADDSRHRENIRVLEDWAGEARNAIRASFVDLAYSATIATNARAGTVQRVTATNGTAFTISNPTNPVAGMRLAYIIKNSSGGAMGAITWGGAFALAGAFTNPANTKQRTIEFAYDGGTWVELARAAADI